VALNEALDDTPHWPTVLGQAGWHGLRPLLHRQLSQAAVERVPRHVLVDLWAGYERGVRRNQAMARELTRILDAFDAHGVVSMPYKGPTLTDKLYGDLGLREFGDLDILVRSDDFERAVPILQSLGYADEFPLPGATADALRHARGQYHRAFQGAPARVELHWRTDFDHPVEDAGDAWWQSLPQVPFLGRSVRAFGESELRFVLCLHGSKHHWSSLDWLVDLAELLRAGGFPGARDVAERARAMGVEKRLYLGLRLARDLLDAPVPDSMQAGCERADVRALATRIDREVFAEPVAHRGFAALRRDLALNDRPIQKVRIAWRAAVEPTFNEWSRWPLPPSLQFLYPALRLARLSAKYLTRSPRTPAAATPRTPPPRPHSTG